MIRYIQMDLISGMMYGEVLRVCNDGVWDFTGPFRDGQTLLIRFNDYVDEYYTFDSKYFKEITQNEYMIGLVIDS